MVVDLPLRAVINRQHMSTTYKIIYECGHHQPHRGRALYHASARPRLLVLSDPLRLLLHTVTVVASAAASQYHQQQHIRTFPCLAYFAFKKMPSSPRYPPLSSVGHSRPSLIPENLRRGVVEISFFT